MLKDTFTTLCLNYTNDRPKVENLWLEIEQHYNSKGRHYHNLQHLENMFMELKECKNQISDWDTILFSLFYHDIIYKPTAKDNEEKSAELAVSRLSEIGCSKEMAERCSALILATKSHVCSTENDINLFTDADLAILGKSWENYLAYSRQVRQEYKIYPDIIYKPGRRRVLKHFLEMEKIYKIEYFGEKYELQARQNLIMELELH
jgi:predicted metal-dependent HD superfamily phosphohydrolase